MRFPADRIGALRRGEITATVRVSHGMRPSGYRVGHAYAIERVEDVRTERVILDEDNTEVRDPSTGEPLTLVHYEREVQKLEEWVEVTARYRDPLDQLRPAVVEAAGFESLEELVDTFRADYGGPAFQMVWVIGIRFERDQPRILAWPDTRDPGGHGDYVGSGGGQDVLHGEPEAIDELTLARYVAENREGDAERERKREQRWENLTLAEQVAWLEGADAQGYDVRRALARVRQDVESGRRRLLRKAA